MIHNLTKCYRVLPGQLHNCNSLSSYGNVEEERFTFIAISTITN